MAKGKKASQGKAWLEDKGKGKEAKTLWETKSPEANQGKEATPKKKESEPINPQAVA